MNSVTYEELAETVSRMEQCLSQSHDSDVRRLWEHYQRLTPRLEQDLAGSDRDIALAKASALMIVQSVEQSGRAAQ